MKRRGVTVLLVLAALGVSVWAVDTETTWKGIKMFKKVKKVAEKDPIRSFFQNAEDIEEVELTDEFNAYKSTAAEFNLNRKGQAEDESAATTKAAVLLPSGQWVHPIWANVTSGITFSAGYDAASNGGEYITRAIFPFTKVLRWMFLQREGTTTSTITLKDWYMDEWVTFYPAGGGSSDYVAHNVCRLNQGTGCGTVDGETGCWDQSVVVQDWLRGSRYRFNMMYLHSDPSDIIEDNNPADPKLRPVYDYRDGIFYVCEITIP